MFIQNIMLAARGQGLHTCPQAAFAWYHQIVRRHVPLADKDIVPVSHWGMPNTARSRKRPETHREPVAAITSFHGFKARAR